MLTHSDRDRNVLCRSIKNALCGPLLAKVLAICSQSPSSPFSEISVELPAKSGGKRFWHPRSLGRRRGRAGSRAPLVGRRSPAVWREAGGNGPAMPAGGGWFDSAHLPCAGWRGGKSSAARSQMQKLLVRIPFPELQERNARLSGPSIIRSSRYAGGASGRRRAEVPAIAAMIGFMAEE